MVWDINIGTATDVKTDIPSNVEDFDVKHFETFDELIQTSGALSTVNNDYLVQVNRWLVRTIHGDIFPDGHIPTTDTNKLLHIVEGTMTQKILNDETTGFEDIWTVEELCQLPGITMFTTLPYKS